MKYSSEKITAMATLPTIPMIITLKRITTPILLKKKCKTTVLMFWIKLLMKKMKPPTPMTTTTTMMMMTMMMMLREEIKSSSARIATTIKRSKLLYLYCVTSKESITRLRGCVITLASWCFWLTVKPRSTQPSVEDIIRSLLTPITSVSGGGNLVSVTPPISIASVVTDQEIEIGVDIATFAVAGHESVLGLDFGNFAFINQEIGLGFAFAFGVVAEVIIHSEFSSGSMFATFFQSKWASGVNLAFIFEVSQLNSMNEKAFMSARLPGDILDDIPSKYLDGILVCEVMDYRKSVSKPESVVSSVDQSPIVNKVSLWMSLENVVKDMPLISDDSWTYSDLMEFESPILKVLQPQLYLDPTPMLDRLCGNPVTTKLNFGLSGSRKRRLRKMPEVTIVSNNRKHEKKICTDRIQESSNWRSGNFGNLSGDTSHYIHESMNAQHVLNNSLPLRYESFGPEVSTSFISLLPKHHQGGGYPRVLQDHYSGPPMNASGFSPSVWDFIVSCIDMMSCSVSSMHGKRGNQDAPLTPSSKGARKTSVGLDGSQMAHLGPQLDNLPDISCNNSSLHPHPDPIGLQYGSMGGQNYPKRVFEGVSSQDGSVSLFNLEHQESKYAIKGEQTETFDKTQMDRSRKDSHLLVAENSQMDAQESRLQQKLPQHLLVRSHQESKYAIKGEQTETFDKTEMDRCRKDPHLLVAENSQMDAQESRLQQRLPQNLLMRSHFLQTQWHNLGQPVDNDPRKEDQIAKWKLAQSPRVSAVPVVQSPVSSKSGEFSNGSFGQHFNDVATTTTFGSSQKEKGGGVSGLTVGGPTSEISSPSDSMQRQHQGSIMKWKSNSLPRTPAMNGVGSPASVSIMIIPTNANSPSVNDPTCITPKSKSPIGGSMNVCKTRILTFVHSKRRLQGTVVSLVPKARNKLMMLEKQRHGTVAMQYLDVDDGDFSLVQNYLTPNTMVRQRYQLTEDEVRPKQTSSITPNGQTNPPARSSNSTGADMQQYPESNLGQSSNAVTTQLNSVNPSLNISQSPQNSTWVLPPGRNQTLQISQGFMPGAARPTPPQQLKSQQTIQQQRSQHNLIPERIFAGFEEPSFSLEHSIGAKPGWSVRGLLVWNWWYIGTGQMHPGSAGLSMLGQTLNRSNTNPLARTNMASMGPPNMIPGTNFDMNQQLQHQQQQLQFSITGCCFTLNKLVHHHPWESHSRCPNNNNNLVHPAHS